MKTQTIYLTSLILLSVSSVVPADMTAPSTTNGLHLRYGSPAGKVELSVNHDISAGGHQSIASRQFSMDFELGDAPGAIAFEITRVKGSYIAHDMTQRLPASGLSGQTFYMNKADDNRALQRTDSDSKLEIGVGQMIGGNYPVGLALADIMPELPEGPISVDSTWESTRDTLSLEGWAWTRGQLISEHQVTDLQQEDGHTIVGVTSTSHAQLSDVDGGVVFSGDGELKRTSHWRFDVTGGRVLSISMEQETFGVNTMPQGNMDVRQITKVEYSTK